MKRFIFIMAALVCCAAMSFGQECYCIYGGTETNGNKGGVYVFNGDFYLLGMTDYRYEKRMASIYLGDTPDKAIVTLKSLQSLSNSKLTSEKYVGLNGRTTRVRQGGCGLKNCLLVKTEGIGGECYLLCSGFDYEMAIMAIGEYDVNLPLND